MEHSRSDNNNSHKPLEGHIEAQDGLAIDTTDDEQEELPYDGILECYLVPSLQQDDIDNPTTPIGFHQALISTEASQPTYSPTETTTDNAIYFLDSSDLFSLSDTASNPITQTNDDKDQESEKLLTNSTIIPDVLLRHINEDNLLNSSEFITFETMPEISIFESSDETVISRKSDAQCPYEEQEDFKEEYLEMQRREYDSIQENTCDETNTGVDETFTKANEENDSALIQENVEVDEFPPDDVDKETKQPTHEPTRRPSYEMKYGQGQVHYKLPDFSKVPPKVKIPKIDNGGSVKPGQFIKKAASSNNLIGQSFLIKDILDSMQPPVQPGQMIEDAPFLDQCNEQALVDSHFNSKVNTGSPAALENVPSGQFPTLAQDQTEVVGCEDNCHEKCSSQKPVIEESNDMEFAQVLTEGEKMTSLLMEQAQTLKIKVFQNFKTCLETLEIDYLSTKEKHRDLQLQTYRTGSQTVGEFDIERELEGHIFRLGMLLEDIQEEINRSEESETRSASSTSSSIALVLSHTQNEGVNDMVPKHDTDEVTRFSNSTKKQLEQDSSMGKEAEDELHPYLHPDTSADVIDHGQDLELDEDFSVNHVTTKEATKISNDNSPLILSGQLCSPQVQNAVPQMDSAKQWILAEHSEFVEERQITRKLKNSIGEYPLHVRYQEVELRKTQSKFRNPKNLPIFVQEGALNLDLADCNGTQDSENTDWLLSTHSRLFQCKSTGRRRDRTDLYKGLHSDILASSSAVWHNYSNKKSLTTERHGQLLSPETDIKEYPGQKSLWPSKHWLCVPNQRSLSDRLHHIDSNIIRYSPSSRSGRSSASHLSLLTDSSISTVQRKRWKNVSADNLDYRETKILNYVLDNALRTAKNMQRTTERMVQKLASDLGNPTSRSSFTL